MHFRAVVGCDETADLVSRAVDLRRPLGSRAMEEVHEAPGDFLGVLFQRGLREQLEEVGPDGCKGVLYSVVRRQIARAIGVLTPDIERSELELGQLCSKGRAHGFRLR